MAFAPSLRAGALVLLVPAAGLAGGCGGVMYDGYVVQRSAPSVPKQGVCEFQVVSTLPREGSFEIATLTLKNGINGNVPRDAERFRADVREQVCGVGGDLVVTEVNGRGDIVRGIVFRRQ